MVKQDAFGCATCGLDGRGDALLLPLRDDGHKGPGGLHRPHRPHQEARDCYRRATLDMYGASSCLPGELSTWSRPADPRAVGTDGTVTVLEVKKANNPDDVLDDSRRARAL